MRSSRWRCEWFPTECTITLASISKQAAWLSCNGFAEVGSRHQVGATDTCKSAEVKYGAPTDRNHQRQDCVMVSRDRSRPNQSVLASRGGAVRQQGSRATPSTARGRRDSRALSNFVDSRALRRLA
eukprot:2655392-Pleurochrysis_carterae.AAC.2